MHVFGEMQENKAVLVPLVTMTMDIDESDSTRLQPAYELGVRHVNIGTSHPFFFFFPFTLSLPTVRDLAALGLAGVRL